MPDPVLYLSLLYNTILSVVGFNFDVLAIPHSKIARVLRAPGGPARPVPCGKPRAALGTAPALP